ncbi:potassium-transporting ATPase subunit C [Fictibacillus macauensis ZFHKF-1]|uniref:Potassium-transporting ATPase KdpC subunit n=2 Tax=Fictibacillus TaxID=1329200 RepID=I8J1H8_9BACL|nr:potassium-transporting ATPase subunit C [Fictibacillus macauensis ZFHKF-1]
MIVICGVIYPLAMTGVSQLVFPDQANASLTKNKEGKVIGSELIGQDFKGKQFFHGRISSIENNAAASGSNNYAPSNKDLIKRVEKSIVALKKENGNVETKDIPVDLLTNSGSGLDPHISVEAAKFQVPRVSKEAGISIEKLDELIKDTTEKRSLGVFGEPRVNVLLLNLKVQELQKK